MTLEEAIVERLTGYAPLAALVADRVYPLMLPQDVAWPAITYQRISGVSDHHLGGPSGLTETRLQVDVWSQVRDGVDAHLEARRVALQVKAALDGFRGDVASSDSPPATLRIKSARLENDQDLEEDEPRTYRVSLDFMIAHDEET